MTEKDERDPLPPGLADEITEHKWFFWIGGILSILFGAFAILMPHVATLAAGLAIGIILAANGVVGCITAFRARRASRIAMGFFLGVLCLAAGVLLLAFPVSGIIALTLVLTAFLLASGVLKLFFAWQIRPSAGWAWMLTGGLLSIGLGIIIWSGLPGTAFWVLGLIVGIDLIFYGATLLAMIIAARRTIGYEHGELASESPYR